MVSKIKGHYSLSERKMCQFDQAKDCVAALSMMVSIAFWLFIMTSVATPEMYHALSDYKIKS